MYVPVPAHGGLTEPICRTVPADEIDDFLARAETLPKIPRLRRRSVHRLPVGRRRTQPLERADGLGHLPSRAGRSGHRAQRQALCLDHSHRPAGRGRAGRHASRPAKRRPWSTRPAEIVATLDVSDVFPWDKPRYLRERLPHRPNRPSRRRHGPDGRRRQDAPPGRYHPRAAAAQASPLRQVRAHAARGPRAAGRQGLGARGRLSDPEPLAPRPRICPGLRAGDAAAGRAQRRRLLESAHRRDQGRRRRRRRPHAHLRSPDRQPRPGLRRQRPALWRTLGESVPDRVLLLGLDIKMFYGGPKEAVMHAIYRQNFGFTDIIIGRKHADAPYHDGKPIWGDFDAQEIFNHLAGDLRSSPCGSASPPTTNRWAGSTSWRTTRRRSRCSFPARRFARPWWKAARSIRGSCGRARRPFCTRPWGKSSRGHPTTKTRVAPIAWLSGCRRHRRLSWRIEILLLRLRRVR